MSMTAMNRAVNRGIRRGIYLSATADTSRLRKIREEAEMTDYTTQTWATVGERLSNAMIQVEKDLPTVRVNSSRQTS